MRNGRSRLQNHCVAIKSNNINKIRTLTNENPASYREGLLGPLSLVNKILLKLRVTVSNVSSFLPL
jgi:hypothetical protein